LIIFLLIIAAIARSAGAITAPRLVVPVDGQQSCPPTRRRRAERISCRQPALLRELLQATLSRLDGASV